MPAPRTVPEAAAAPPVAAPPPGPKAAVATPASKQRRTAPSALSAAFVPRIDPKLRATDPVYRVVTQNAARRSDVLDVRRCGFGPKEILRAATYLGYPPPDAGGATPSGGAAARSTPLAPSATTARHAALALAAPTGPSPFTALRTARLQLKATGTTLGPLYPCLRFHLAHTLVVLDLSHNRLSGVADATAIAVGLGWLPSAAEVAAGAAADAVRDVVAAAAAEGNLLCPAAVAAAARPVAAPCLQSLDVSVNENFGGAAVALLLRAAAGAAGPAFGALLASRCGVADDAAASIHDVVCAVAARRPPPGDALPSADAVVAHGFRAQRDPLADAAAAGWDFSANDGSGPRRVRPFLLDLSRNRLGPDGLRWLGRGLPAGVSLTAASQVPARMPPPLHE